MIFHSEFDSERVFPPTSINAMSALLQKGINLSREERILWKRQERRRRKIQEMKAGVKRFMAMLFSHIGLSLLVVAYTIIGALIFVGLEQHKELAVKDEARKLREENSKRLLRKLFHKLDSWLTTYNMNTCNDTVRLISYVLKLSSQTVKPVEKKYQINDTAIMFNKTDLNATNFTTTASIEIEQPTTESPITPLYTNLAEALQHIIQDGFINFTKNATVLITEEGWDGDYSKTELKWSVAGGVLYAVTVITTIGYGYTTPKTTQGKILTIFYALIGIPLVVLYLSNIGDYLADVFRTIYSRTCRNTCENYCSISLLTSLVRSVLRRYRGNALDEECPNDELIHIDGAAGAATVQFRRRKRVLLKAFSIRTEDDQGEEESDLEQKTSSSLEQQNATSKDQQSNTNKLDTGTKNHVYYSRLRELIKKTGVARITQSPKLISAIKRTRSTITTLLAPITQWIHQFADESAFPTESLIIPNKNTEIRDALASTARNFVHLGSIPNTGVVIPQSDLAGTASTAISIPLKQTHTITARIEDGQSYTHDSIYSNHVPLTSTQKSALPIRVESAFGSTIASQTALEPTSVTVTLPVGLTETVPPPVQQRYFTFDGHHRKFYLDARYLRSAQRQRRHRRRVAKQRKEKAHSELLRLQNELSYGTLRKKPTLDTDAVVSGSTHDQTLEILSLNSESTEDTGIPLVCWKDIDLDLEVRSIDDEEELARIERNRRKQNGVAELSTFNVQQAQELTCAKMVQAYEKRKAQSRRQKRSRRLHKTEQDEHRVLSWVKENNQNTLAKRNVSILPASVSVNHPPVPCQLKERRSVTLEAIAKSTQSDKTMQTMLGPIDSLPNQLQVSVQSPRPVAADRPDLVKYLHSSGLIPEGSLEMLPLSQRSHAHINHSKSTLEVSDPNYQTIVTNGKDGHVYSSINYPYYFQNEHFKSFLHSTVIENPLALEKMKEEQFEKALGQGKSRLSIASSMGDVDSDIQVQLSYYSQQDNGPTEDDLSLFTFGEGFSNDDDISKVTVPISLSLLIMTTYIFLGTIVFSIAEGDDYLKWAYFCFITLTTIGFGDIVPGTKMDSENAKEKMVIITLYVAIGLSVFAMCFKLMQEEVVDKVKWFASKVGIIKGKTKKKTEK